MKIHIFGCSGSGKSYLAKKLSNKYKIPYRELDEIFWDNSKGQNGIKRAPEERDAILRQWLREDDWVIEGVQYAWVGESFAAADVIYVLDTPPVLSRMRIIRRHVERRVKRDYGKMESTKDMIRLLRWTKKFYSALMPEFLSLTSEYREKVVHLRSKSDVKKIIGE